MSSYGGIQLEEDTFENDPFSALAEDDLDLPEPEETSGEKKLIAKLQERIQHASSSRKVRDNTWEYNRLLLAGEQYVGQDITTGEVVRLSFEPDPMALQSVDNLLMETARSAVGKHIRIIPSVVVLPRTEDRSDVRAAEVIDSFADFQWYNLSMKLLYKRGIEYLQWAGTAPYEVCWDKMKGRRLAYCQKCHFASDIEKPGDDCPVCLVQNVDPAMLAATNDMAAAQKGPIQKLTRIREGDVALELHDPRNFFPEPGISEIKNMQWAYTRTALPVNVARRRHPAKAGLIKAEDGIYAERAVTYAIGSPMSTHYDAQQLKAHVYEYRFHLAPTGKQENGVIVTMMNNRIMEVENSPYFELFDQLPFEALRSDREAGSFWGIPPISNASGPQKERNTLATQTRENRELTGNPKLLVGENSGLNSERMNTVSGEVIKVKATTFGRPAYLIPPALSQHVYSEFERLARAIRGKFGVTDNEVGIAPAEQSGRLGAILEAQGNEAISPIVLENMESWLHIQLFVILVGLKYYPADRRWAVRGQDMPRSYSFGMADDIRSGWNLMLADEDSLSKNPALRLQQALLLWDKGIFTDLATQKPNTKKFLRAANLRLPGQAADSDGAHRAYAAMIPEMVRRGLEDPSKAFTPKPWDDAVICAEELAEWLRAQADKAPEPVVRAVVNVWVIYAQAALSLGLDPRMAPNAGLIPPPGAPQPGQPQPGRQQGAPGAPGTPTQGPGPGAPPASLGAEAGQLIQQADAQAEGAARAQKREG